MRVRPTYLLLIALILILFTASASAGRKLDVAIGQKVYVPVYNYVYQGPKNRPYALSTLLSIRNVDYTKSVVVPYVDFYNTEGQLVKKYLDKPIVIPPMATKEFYIPERDITGGSGANFTLEWSSEGPVSIPIIQAVMIGTASTQGISFVCDGVAIEEH